MDKKIEKEFRIEKSTSQLGRFWNWLWHSDSILSWIVALIFAFIIVKFIFFPILSFLLGTSLPLVVVESGSMSHPEAGFLGNTFSTSNSFNNFWSQQGEWYLERNITQPEFSQFPFRTGMEKGDIIIVWGRSSPKIGDIIVFNANQAYPIIHRIVNISYINNQVVYSTKGDNNPDQLYIEKTIPKDAVIGKSVFRVPKLGWLKLIFVEIINAFR